MNSMLVAVEGGMDFRAMLMKRKKPQKKVVVVSPSQTQTQARGLANINKTTWSRSAD